MERYLLIVLGTLSAMLKGMLKCSMERYLFIIIVRNIVSSFSKGSNLTVDIGRRRREKQLVVLVSAFERAETKPLHFH